MNLEDLSKEQLIRLVEALNKKLKQACKDSGGRVLTKGTLEREYYKYEPKPASRFRLRKPKPVIEGKTGRDNN